MHFHYGMPHSLIVDFGMEVQSDDVTRLCREFKTYLRRGVNHVVLCLEDLEVVDQDFFSAIGDLHEELKDWGGVMVATGASPQIRHVMQLHDRKLVHFDRLDEELPFFSLH